MDDNKKLLIKKYISSVFVKDLSRNIGEHQSTTINNFIATKLIHKSFREDVIIAINVDGFNLSVDKLLNTIDYIFLANEDNKSICQTENSTKVP